MLSWKLFFFLILCFEQLVGLLKPANWLRQHSEKVLLVSCNPVGYFCLHGPQVTIIILSPCNNQILNEFLSNRVSL